jgi:DNA-binding transcriptional MerR regulator
MVYYPAMEIMLSVSRLSKMAGVSIRTIHYYDEIGLLKPTHIRENGYRQYGNEALLILQQILFYRELDFSLKDISNLLKDGGFNVKETLKNHRQLLQGRIDRLKRLITTVDKTISMLEGRQKMSVKGLFDGFSDEEQEQYAQEEEKLYDPEIVRASNRKWKAYSSQEKERILQEGREIYQGIIAGMPGGASSIKVQDLISKWHKHLQYFWNPNDEQLIALGGGYNMDPRFKANFDAMHPGLAAFMLEAIKVYVEKRKSKQENDK